MKECFKCHLVKPLQSFYPHSQMKDGYLNKCKDCTLIDVKARYRDKREVVAEYDRKRNLTASRKAKRRETQRRLRRSNPEKTRTRQRTSRAIRQGILKRRPCQVCGNPESQAHHLDYLKPLEVAWLCFKHHRAAHGQVTLD